MHHQKPLQDKSHNMGQIPKLSPQKMFNNFEGQYNSKIEEISNLSDGRKLLASPGVSLLLEPYNHEKSKLLLPHKTAKTLPKTERMTPIQIFHHKELPHTISFKLSDHGDTYQTMETAQSGPYLGFFLDL